MRRGVMVLWAALALGLAARAEATEFVDPWPEGAAVAGIEGRRVEFATRSPFALADVRAGEEAAPSTLGRATLYLPRGYSRERPAPAVVMLHGAGGVLGARELTYGPQFAAMGIAALVVETYGARRDRATTFTERLIEITEAMFLADAFAALDWLAQEPAIDPRRVALVGFSYGGMVALLAAFEQVARAYAPDGRRFAAHIAYYGPCIARLRDRRATGAPVLMLYGTADEIVDPKRCAEVMGDLEAGGAAVRTIAFPGAFHQWDGGFGGPYRIGRTLNDCRLTVEADGIARDDNTWLAMSGSFSRKIILGLCAGSGGYLIGRDDAVRAQSNRAVAEFLARAFAR
ncbi:MAG: dienelactone hydrolase [Alphaproteobacteria bacterium]|nr:dienelactone hydrolase [Alphaproteobacteria bacterium]